jgi:hypothetical protein
LFRVYAVASDGPVKKSIAGICHAPGRSPYYERVIRYAEYETLSECLKSGGRLPKRSRNKHQNFVFLTKERLPKEALNYNRRDWPHWVDWDGDCQNERHEVLIEQSKIPVKFKRNRGCSVSWGLWRDPYSGREFTKASDLDIDHIVPLMWAHQHGGYRWSREEKRQFANDHENLIAVQKELNREKGAQGPDMWLPPNEKFRCTYVKRFLSILNKYKLQLWPSEQLRYRNVEQRVCHGN